MSNLTFLPAPWFLAIPDFEDAPEPQPALLSPPKPLSFWRLALVVVLTIALAWPANLAGMKTSQASP